MEEGFRIAWCQEKHSILYHLRIFLYTQFLSPRNFSVEENYSLSQYISQILDNTSKNIQKSNLKYLKEFILISWI